jgi:cysteine-rich repeat protein
MKNLKLAVVLMAAAMFCAPAMAQDDCLTAVPVGTPVEPCDDTTPTGPLGNCTSGGGLLDVWMTFVASAPSHRIRTDLSSSGSDSDFLVLSGACGSQTVIGCSEDEVGPYLGDICVGGLTAGNTYYIRLGTWADGCPNGPYVVDVQADPGAVCGDGTLDCGGVEECDDGNMLPGDGCENCQIAAICGDGIRTTPPEECDDSNTMSGDGCSATCELEPNPGQSVPAVSEWGLVVLVLIGLSAGTVVFGRRREVA